MIESCCKLEHVFEKMRISASRQTRKAHSYLTGHGLLQLLPKVVCCSGVSLDGRLPTAEVLAAPDTTAVGNMKMAECSQDAATTQPWWVALAATAEKASP